MRQCFPLIFSIFFYCILCLRFLECEAGLAPALIWSNREIQNRIGPDRGPKKGSPSFRSHLSEIFKKGQPLVIVFLEPYLDPAANVQSILEDVAKKYRIDKFENVESPHEILVDVTGKTHHWKKWENNTNLTGNNAWMLEFEKNKSFYPQVLSSRGSVINEICEYLNKTGTEWIAMYTGKNVPDSSLENVKPSTTWHLEYEPGEKKSEKALSVFRDEYTGLTMIIRGTIRLSVPSRSGNFGSVNVNLENHTSASEKHSDIRRKINFFVTFPNYTLIFFINTANRDWIIEKIRITNDDGDSLNLMAKTKILLPEHKCVDHLYEFQSLKEPFVTVKIAKYKFIRSPFQEEPCAAPFSFHIIFSFIFLSIVTFAVSWESIMKNRDFKRETKIFRVSPETLLTFPTNLDDLN